MGAYQRRTAEQDVREFLRGLPDQPIAGKAIYEAYCADDTRFPLTMSNFGRLLSEIGITKRRTNTGVFYFPQH